MDFVVVGVGIGALAILLGLIVRDAGSWWVRRAASRAPTDPRRTRTLHGVCRAAGRALALDGLVLLAVTAVALFAGWSDRAGATAVMLALAIVLLGSIGWAFRYTQRHYSRPPRRSARMAGSPAIAADPPPDVRIDAGDTHALSDHDVAARTASAGELAQAEASVAGADPPLTKESASGAETDRASDTSVDSVQPEPGAAAVIKAGNAADNSEANSEPTPAIAAPQRLLPGAALSGASDSNADLDDDSASMEPLVAARDADLLAAFPDPDASAQPPNESAAPTDGRRRIRRRGRAAAHHPAQR